MFSPRCQEGLLIRAENLLTIRIESQQQNGKFENDVNNNNTVDVVDVGINRGCPIVVQI